MILPTAPMFSLPIDRPILINLLCASNAYRIYGVARNLAAVCLYYRNWWFPIEIGGIRQYLSPPNGSEDTHETTWRSLYSSRQDLVHPRWIIDAPYVRLRIESD